MSASGRAFTQYRSRRDEGSRFRTRCRPAVGLIDNRQGAYVVFDIVSIASTIAASTLIVITCRDIIWSARMRMISKRLSGQIPI